MDLSAPAFHCSRPVLLTLGLAGIVILLAGIMPLIASPYRDSGLAATIDQDNREVCEGLGFHTGSLLLSHCTASLAALRRRHEAVVSASLP